jgi:rhodanese-related sulfurtransferase
MTSIDFYYSFYLLVDVRDPAQYDAGHIFGAINLPYAEIDSWLGTLDQDLQDSVLFVVDEDGSVALDVATRLEAEGFTSAYALRGGLLEWLYVFQDTDPLLSASVTLPEGYSGIGGAPEEGEVRPMEVITNFRLLIDVRTAELYAENHFLGAINRPFTEREEWLVELPQGVEIIFYGADGSQSDRLAQEAVALGYLEAFSLLDGLSGWFTQYSEFFLTSLGLMTSEE